MSDESLYPTAFDSTILSPESVIYSGGVITDQTTAIPTAQPAYSFVPKTLTTTNYTIVQLQNPWFNALTNTILNYVNNQYYNLYGSTVTNVDGYVAVTSTQYINIDSQSLLATGVVSTSGATTIKHGDYLILLGNAQKHSDPITILGKSTSNVLPSTYFDRSFTTVGTSIAYSSLFVRDIDVSQTQANAAVLEKVYATYDLMYTLSGKKFDLSIFNTVTPPQIYNDLEPRVRRLEEKTKFQKTS